MIAYDRHAGFVFGSVARFLGDREAAAEVVQDAFVTLWRRARQFDARSGSLVRELQLAKGAGATFVNDVVVTKRAAYFTDSNRAVLYRLGLAKNGAPAAAAQAVPLTGAFQLVPGFNLNGIDATPDGKTLVVVQSANGKLFSVAAATGVTREVALGGATLPNGDGLLLHGRTLYVVQNQLNRIAVVLLAKGFASGSIERTITDSDFDVPTTIDSHGNRLYAVNARFGTAPGPSTPQPSRSLESSGTSSRPPPCSA